MQFASVKCQQSQTVWHSSQGKYVGFMNSFHCQLYRNMYDCTDPIVGYMHAHYVKNDNVTKLEVHNLLQSSEEDLAMAI